MLIVHCRSLRTSFMEIKHSIYTNVAKVEKLLGGRWRFSACHIKFQAGNWWIFLLLMSKGNWCFALNFYGFSHTIKSQNCDQQSIEHSLFESSKQHFSTSPTHVTSNNNNKSLICHQRVTWEKHQTTPWRWKNHKQRNKESSPLIFMTWIRLFGFYFHSSFFCLFFI